MYDQVMAVKQFKQMMQIDFVHKQMPAMPLLCLEHMGRQLVNFSKQIEEHGLTADPDRRYLQAHLMMEELGECLVAMGQGHEVLAFDAMVDLLYVLLGAFLCFDFPVVEGFEEVQRSNMTKRPREAGDQDHRLREKGGNYSAPDLCKVLAQHRGKENIPTSGFGMLSMLMQMSEQQRRLLRGAMDAMVCTPQTEEFATSRLETIFERMQVEYNKGAYHADSRGA